ncbi:MAG: DNA mismatch repair endonuclease MutL [Clostridiales bacterium]|nr:DNA mismatch repair endonuclease MutL [Clostridiales bacterium]
MAKINILDDFTVNQIAAGEVIERPSSIVKELVENSIDADSSAITIEIKDGGTTYIRVTDNGEGMDTTDARLCFQRHATSKIKSNTDLYSINSLGFRGEALASIAAVSQVEMFTSPRGEQGGIHIINHGGDIISEKEIGCPEGTTIVVRNLFYNAPARLKFLKSTRAETASVSGLISRLILAHPAISFRYINQGKTVYHSPGNGSLLSAIITVYGKNIKNSIIEIDRKNEESKISLYGYMGDTSLARLSRNYQTFIVNGRYVKSPLLTKAVEDAHRSYLVANRYPLIILHLNLPPDQIDVNVHPAKTEIKFRDEEAVYNHVYNWIKDYLDNNPHIPVVDRESLKLPGYDDKVYRYKQIQQKEADGTIIKREQINIFDPQSQEPRHVYVIKDDSSENPKQTEEDKTGIEDGDYEHNIDKFKAGFLKILGRVFSTYILIEEEDRLYLMDQHAAHERLIYEELKEGMENRTIASQQLLPSLILELTHDESIIVEAARDTFTSLGFEIEHFGGNTWAVRGVPNILKGTSVRELFNYVLDQCKADSQSSHSSMVLKPEDIMRAACRQAVKARDSLSDKELLYLLESFRKKDIPLTCPHGRPIIITITKYELEKMFKRIQ